MNCRKCGTCCSGPDISTLGKPAGIPCRYLDERCQCAIYDDRPPVCRGYMPDEICELVDAPTLDKRTANFLRLFGLSEEVDPAFRASGDARAASGED